MEHVACPLPTPSMRGGPIRRCKLLRGLALPLKPLVQKPPAFRVRGIRDQMRLSMEEHPVMLAEPTHNNREARERMVQLMFEKYKVPGGAARAACATWAGRMVGRLGPSRFIGRVAGHRGSGNWVQA